MTQTIAVEFLRPNSPVQRAWAKIPDEPAPGERAALQERIKRLLEEHDATLVSHYYVHPDLQDLAEETGGIVTVCAPPSFAARWLVPRLGSFSRAHPDIDLRLSSSGATIDNPDKIAAAEANSATAPKHDLMIRFGHGHYPGSTVDRLFSPAYVTAVSYTHLTLPTSDLV